MFTEIYSFREFFNLKEELAVLTYFSTETCNVCKVLKPKIAELVQNYFPEIKLFYINSEKLPELAAQNQIFAAPTILVFFEGREFIRKSRNFGIDELRQEMERPYNLVIENRDTDFPNP
jgi:thiol-disulfide isomerase/thioredoxin